MLTAILNMRPGYAVCKTTSDNSLQSKYRRNGRAKQTTETCRVAEQQHGQVWNSTQSVSLVSGMLGPAAAVALTELCDTPKGQIHSCKPGDLTQELTKI